MDQDQNDGSETADSFQEEIAAQHAEFQETLDGLAESSGRADETEDYTDQD